MNVRWEELIAAAQEARKRAYAPYSRFSVGAAVLWRGQVAVGCNVENASYPNGICAERAAVAHAVSRWGRGADDPLEALVLAAEPLIVPCGMCLQVVSEFCADVPILCVSATGERREVSLSSLLPGPFRLESG